ncbi:atrial natriuretic peptide receptor 1-like [Sinocyclocheilus grahami]|uniref:atrial natriuretic peptide receptor 1-like n=1 Tax=Sinocyclocheilus grahami TaxID=75366 RepID=UPI0007AC7C28|nr:PREDICTED: atrial natriuretic peptide receptor 1-like [Sinocyclocheilus grahami]
MNLLLWFGGGRSFLLLLILLCCGTLPIWTKTSRHQGSRRPVHNHTNDIILAVILPQHNTSYPWAWPRVGPALDRAIAHVNADPTLLPRHHIRHIFANSEDGDGICSESIAPLMAVDLKFEHNPWAFIGPGCDYTSSPVGLFTAHWGLPMITAGAPAVAFMQMEMYTSITNTGPTHKKLGEYALHLYKHFGWHQHTLLMFSDTKMGERACYFALEGLYTEMHEDNITTMDLVFEENKGPVNYSELLHKIQDDGRVVFVCCSLDIFRQLMVHFHRAGLPKEEYVFFYIDIFGRSLESRPSQPWARGDPDDVFAKEAFQSVKILTYLEPQNQEYKEFVNDLKSDAKQMFNFTVEDSLMNIISGGFYDGLMLYCNALNESLAEAHDRPSGESVTKRMWNRTYYGVTGLVQIDENGDRETDFALWDMTDTNSGNFQTVAVYNGTQKQMKILPGMAIQWPGGNIPWDVPLCGFKNDNPACHARTIAMHQMISIVLFLILVIIFTVTVFIYRKLKLEKELVAQLWRILWEDIQMGNLEKAMRSTGSKFTLSLRGSNYGSLLTADGNFQVFAKTGYFKGNIVAIKYINRKRIDLTRKVLFELKHMRDVQNEHLTRFIGACIDPPNVCIVTEYCPRGSLQDILENESITLDWMFKYSLVSDIVKGMAFIHNSVIVSHGNLKSSNCVVDNRFVLKITDYGLSSIRTESDTEDAHSYYARKLWMAPELLRMECFPPGGTQKGDVYSFGIILQEVALRRGVFYLEGDSLSPKEIVDRVALGEWPYLRPSVNPQAHSEELGQLMQRCWAEEPSDRPEFNHISVLLRKQNREHRSNILDNLLSRMEQYANNLEELVEERTQAYLEEKRKAEALLYQILPQSIHVSSATQDVLQEFNCFQLELRGDVEMKGKGKMRTYWLLGEINNSD